MTSGPARAAPWLVAAVSGRMLAASAARGGHRVVVLDCFADRDTKAGALVARAGEGKAYTVGFEDLPLDAWPAGDVVIRVSHSGLNYKDALAITQRAQPSPPSG